MKNNRTVKMACNLFFPPKLHSTDMTWTKRNYASGCITTF
jgi:hypothetical protein